MMQKQLPNMSRKETLMYKPTKKEEFSSKTPSEDQNHKIKESELLSPVNEISKLKENDDPYNFAFDQK